MKYLKDTDEKKEEPISIKKVVNKKKKYKVLVVTPEFVIYSDEGNGCRTKNVWKDLKIGDEISL